MKHDKSMTAFKPGMSDQELAELGAHEVAYMKPMTSEEVMDKFPMVEGLQPGLRLWALFAANGAPLALADDPGGILSNAQDLELQTVALH